MNEQETTNQVSDKPLCRVSVDFHNDVKEVYQEHAKAMGETLAAFLRRAAREQMVRDNE